MSWEAIIDQMKEWVQDQGYLQTSFVDRGDNANWDFTTLDFTTDFAWHELDLSGIVPEGASAVLLRVVGQAAAVSALFLIQTAGNVNNRNLFEIGTQVAGVFFASEAIIPLTADRKIEYLATNVAWALMGINVNGWWL